MTEAMFVNAVCGITGVFGLVCLISIIVGIVAEMRDKDKYQN